MEFKVTYADGRVDEVGVIPSARRAVEAEYDKPMTEIIKSGKSDWCDLLVWTVLKIRHSEARTLDDWLATVDRLEFAVTAEPSPTSARTRKRSASSGPRSTKAKTSTD